MLYEGGYFSKLFFENYLCGGDVARMLDGEMAASSGWGAGVEPREEFEILDPSLRAGGPAVWGGGEDRWAPILTLARGTAAAAQRKGRQQCLAQKP